MLYTSYIFYLEKAVFRENGAQWILPEGGLFKLKHVVEYVP